MPVQVNRHRAHIVRNLHRPAHVVCKRHDGIPCIIRRHNSNSSEHVFTHFRRNGFPHRIQHDIRAGLLIDVDHAFAVAVHESARCRNGPANERITRARERAAVKLRRLVLHERLVLHPPHAAVRIGADSVARTDPYRVEVDHVALDRRHVGKRLAVGIHRRTVLGQRPAGEGIADTAERVGPERHGITVGEILILDLVSSVVRVEAYRVAVGRPVRKELVRRLRHLGRNLDVYTAVCIRPPAREREVFAHGHGQLAVRTFGHVVVLGRRHGTAACVEAHLDRRTLLPVRIERVWLGEQHLR